MNKKTENNILYQLTGKHSFEETTVEELNHITASLPYFGPAQLLLAKKMQLSKNDGLQKQVQKTALHFSNPFWLHYQLIKDEWNNDKDEEALTGNSATTADVLEQKIAVIEEKPEEFLIQPIAESGPAHSENLHDTLTEETTSEENIDKREDAPEEINSLSSNEKMTGILAEQLAEFNKPVEENAEIRIETEPYYTVDYFASQGIKLQAIEDAKDKLTVKMRKFTDWLREMKRINPHPTDLGSDEATVHLIQDIAETSNISKEIITETMAEVLAKQGKLDKAIQVYIKLSFLNPSRSAYFVAKIRELKDI